MTELVKIPRAKTGSCSINVNCGKLRIRLPRCIGNGKQIFLYTRLEDTPANHNKALAVVLMIDRDIELGRLDTSLDRYLAAILDINGKNQILDFTKHQASCSLLSLWGKYAQSRKKQISPGTFTKHFLGHVPRAIAQLPSQDVNDAVKIRDFLLENRTPNAAKRLLMEFSTCCDWATLSKIIDCNPFDGLVAGIKVQNYSWKNIDPFTKTERDRILEAFDLECPQYKDFVRFAFATGARLGEVVALQWKDISSDYSNIYFSQTFDQKYGRKQTKTHENRVFPCNSQLQDFLKSLQPINFLPTDVVFKSPDGAEIKLDRFLRLWKGRNNNSGTYKPGIVQKLADLGEIKRYRCPYCMRHSFISSCLEHGTTAQQVSAWCGNSPQTIYRHYAGVVNKSQPPIL